MAESFWNFSKTFCSIQINFSYSHLITHNYPLCQTEALHFTV